MARYPVVILLACLAFVEAGKHGQALRFEHK